MLQGGKYYEFLPVLEMVGTQQDVRMIEKFICSKSLFTCFGCNLDDLIK